MNINPLQSKLFQNEFSFPAFILQKAFGLYFLLVGIKKFRVDGVLDPVNGLLGFANSVTKGAMNTEVLAREIPSIFLYPYGLFLPFIELSAGILLLIGAKVRLAYSLIGFTYLTFIFGQMYSGNTGKIGTDYLPSLLALSVAVYTYQKNETINFKE